MQRPAKPFTPVRFRLQPPSITSIMNVGIIGYGFVGKALRSGLKDEVDCIEIDSELSLLKKANTINNNIRGQYNDVTVREIAKY